MSLSIKKSFKSLAVIFSLVYLCLFIIAIVYSDKLIFLPPTPSYSWSDNFITIKSTNNLKANEKNTLAASYLKNPKADYTILYSHGNAVDMGGLQHLQKSFFQHGYSIIIYDYSGYGLSEGEVSEQQVYNDATAVYNYLIKHEKLNPEQIISYGHSLGTAIATDLAFKKPIAALVLESAFTTVFRVKTIYPLLPFDKFSSIDKIDAINAPVFITHSRDDPVISFWHGEALFDKAKKPKTALWLDHEGHSNITHNPLFWIKLDSFIKDFIAPVNKAP